VRRPARLERAGALTPRDRIWAAIRRFGTEAEFSIADLMALSEQRNDTTLSYIRGLEKAGYLVAGAEQRVPALRQCYELRHLRLVRDVGVEAPRVDAEGKTLAGAVIQQQIWNAVRRMKGADFDWRAVMQACSHPMTMDTLKEYLRRLARGGYLRVMVEARARHPARYRFVTGRDTGPRAPVVDREDRVMDGNTGAVAYDPSLQFQGGEYDR